MGIYQRKDRKNDAWWIKVQSSGKVVRKKIGSKDTALAVQKKLESQIADAKAAGKDWTGLKEIEKEKNQKTFAQVAHDYMEERAGFKKSSIMAYEHILKRHLLPEFGHLTLKEITSSHVRKYQSRLKVGNEAKNEKPLSESRVNTVIQLLRSIMAQAFMDEELDRDPCKVVPRLQESPTKIDPLSDEDLKLALKNIDDHFRPLYTCLAYTGARPNELIALRWSDIGWTRGEISISKGRVRGAEGKPKTKSSERIIPMSPEVRTVLEELKNRPLQHREGYVFLNTKGKPIDKHLDRIWARALKRAGLRHRASYQLRHTFITHRIMDGLPLLYIARLVGHSKIDTLARHYAGWIDSSTQSYDDMIRTGSVHRKDTPKIEAVSR